ncbi:MAG: alpha/beta fold hydrolase [Actinobacteria bacterium]|nr:MAG: alpha/beta fold hydrolase [Actinomycetota bacterium]
MGRYDPDVLPLERDEVRVRLVAGDEAYDAVLAGGGARLEDAAGDADATLTADEPTWERIASDVRGGMDAFRRRRLTVRQDLHLGVGFLAATSGMKEHGRLRFRTVATRDHRISLLEAGTGPPVVAIHGLGATKASFLPTVAALAPRFRVIAIDLPGFGDSDKPVGARYDARYFATAVVQLLDGLDLDRAQVIGNSLGGRVALELGLRAPDRVDRLALLAPSMAWRRKRPWAPALRLVRPELGVLPHAPRPVVERVLDRFMPEARTGWAAAGVDEFLRSFLTPRGRAAFYAAARQIYLEEPEGEDGFWPRLKRLSVPALFVWGRRDTLVPLAFARHVSEAVPAAEHLELDCGHVPQMERPRETHAAIERFFAHTNLPGA